MVSYVTPRLFPPLPPVSPCFPSFPLLFPLLPFLFPLFPLLRPSPGLSKRRSPATCLLPPASSSSSCLLPPPLLPPASSCADLLPPASPPCLLPPFRAQPAQLFGVAAPPHQLPHLRNVRPMAPIVPGELAGSQRHVLPRGQDSCSSYFSSRAEREIFRGHHPFPPSCPPPTHRSPTGDTGVLH